MKKTYIAPGVIVHELEELCTMLTGSKKEDITTPGNDTVIPGDGTLPGFGGDTEEEPA